MDAAATSESVIAWISAAIWGVVLLSALFYFVASYLFEILAQKLDEPRWMAWVPVVNLYLMLNVANTWDKGWDYWNGIGPNVTAQFIYDNENWWPGAQVRIIPTYTYFVSGELKNEGSGNVEINVGGEFTPTLMWDATLQKNFDVYLNSFRREPGEKLENDWNIFFNVTSYF